MGNDGYYMRRALQVAARPLRTAPNPRVGAVLVRNGRILGEAAHEGAGTPHAERSALERVPAAGATLYVNLEPCTHQGRTPPCAPFVAASGLARVVVATEDPDPRVAGAGVALLRDVGIAVTSGVLADEARLLNAPYFHHRSTGRPFVTVKLALSIDGRLGPRDRDSRWITGSEARHFVHRRRAEVDAVLVGAGSVEADDPRLTAREVGPIVQPTRVVVDSRGRTGRGAAVFADGEAIVATTERAPHERHLEWKEAGAEILVLPSEGERVDLVALLDELGRRGMIELYCEGGAELATALLRRDLVDRLEIHQGAVVIGAGGPEIGDLGVDSLAEARRWKTRDVRRLGEDVVIVREKA